MTSNDSREVKRRNLAADGPLQAVVQRLTERGIIRPDEASDMFALLSAISGGAIHRLPARHRSRPEGVQPERHRRPQRIDKLL